MHNINNSADDKGDIQRREAVELEACNLVNRVISDVLGYIILLHHKSLLPIFDWPAAYTCQCDIPAANASR